MDCPGLWIGAGRRPGEGRAGCAGGRLSGYRRGWQTGRGSSAGERSCWPARGGGARPPPGGKPCRSVGQPPALRPLPPGFARRVSSPVRLDVTGRGRLVRRSDQVARLASVHDTVSMWHCVASPWVAARKSIERVALRADPSDPGGRRYTQLPVLSRARSATERGGVLSCTSVDLAERPGWWPVVRQWCGTDPRPWRSRGHGPARPRSAQAISGSCFVSLRRTPTLWKYGGSRAGERGGTGVPRHCVAGTVPSPSNAWQPRSL